MVIKYTIHRIRPNVFMVVVPDNYDRSMLFLRVQEYAESPSSKMRRHSFDILDFIKWYTETFDTEGFTYAADWNGFNISFRSAMTCYKDLPAKWVNKYDDTFICVLQQISEMLAAEPSLAHSAYIIGTNSINSVTAQHEKYHAMYATNAAYRRTANEAIRQVIPRHIYHKIRKNMIAIGYFDNDYTIHNEMQAYLRGRDWDHPDISENIDKRTLRSIHHKLHEMLSTTSVKLGR